MRALVTGSAGFVGSHLAERLVSEGWEVVGVDSLTPYYGAAQKWSNLAHLGTEPMYRHVDADLRTADLAELVAGVDVVFHQAGQPGVRASWEDFDSYVQHNVLVTRRLLEAARLYPVQRFVYASSSSVYGNAMTHPTREDTLPQPQSPYGVTKLAGEHLCAVYARSWGVPTVSLRYFTVFGPRQRPDMAMHRLVEAALRGDGFPLYGTGDQIRDFTFVTDVVAANLLAATRDVEPGAVFNIAGGGAISMKEVISIVEQLCGRPIVLDRLGEQPGDVARTGADIRAADAALGWAPQVSVPAGLAMQVQWHRERHPADGTEMLAGPTTDNARKSVA